MSTPTAQRLFWINALVAWAGFGGQLFVNIFYLVPSTAPVEATLVGHSAEGWPGAVGRVFDSFSYFTNWSNLVVCIAITALALNPRRTGRIFDTVRNTALFMITMTAILYHLLIAPYVQLESWHAVTSSLEHYITPLVTIVVWALAGPRGRFSFSETLRIYVIPIAWLAYTFVRGALQNVYPYSFFDVAKLGYASVLVLTAEILVAGYVIALAFYGAERLLSRFARANG
jgi:hypothetical protein